MVAQNSIASVVLLEGTYADELINGTSNSDLIRGLAGSDTIHAGKGNDTLFGGSGDDIIYTGEGTDIVFDGAGADIVFLQGAGTIYAGNDLQPGNTFIAIDYSNTGSQELRYNAEALQLTADLAEGSIQTEFGIDIVSGFDVLIFNIQGELKIQGNERDETLRFSADHGGVFGSGGNDLLVGLSQGSYFIDGGSGNDTIRSGAADFGQGRGGTGNDLIFGGRGVQDFEGGTGNDTIHAKAGNDALRGNDGNDILYGGDGGDILIGDEGNDKLCGGDGGDSFDCNDGADTVFGGDGQDSFRIYFGYGKTPSGTVIRDFRPSEGETLSLYAFPIAGGPLVPMYFNGTDSFNHVAGEVRYTPISGKVVLQCDVDGDGRADFSIKLLGLASIDANDLIFGA